MNSMKLLRAPLAALVALFTLSLSTASWAQPEAKPGEVIVKFKATASAAERQAIESDLGMTQVRRMDAIHAERGHVSRLTVDQAIARYRKHPKVEYIEPNYILHASLVPNDPSFPQLWGMQNTGQTGGTPGADIRAVSAWSQFTGSRSIIVAIIDTGMDYNHPDLAANAWVNANEIPNNGLDDDHNGFVDDEHGWDFANNDRDPIDDHGHGTHCSGTIGAVGDNGIGVAGVNWQVTLMPVKFLDASGSGATDAAVSSINYAVQMGARVISASWGGGGASQALEDAISAAGQAGVLFVAAAGNFAQNTDVFPNYPSSYALDNIIAVAATDHNDQLASFSNYGVVSVDLAAPGVDIYSTLPGGYGMFSGTSMATPHVAGAVALILGRFPSITAPAAKNLLLNRVDPLASLAGRVLTGGRLNAFLPIADPDSTAPAKITTLGVQGINGTWVALSWQATGDDGLTGRASNYQLRYSTSPLTEATFDSSRLVPGTPAPSPAGSPESMTVSGLAFSTPYYFAIKAYDEFGNASPMSNVATATTLAPPDVSVSPASLDASLFSGQQTTRVLTLSNSGPSELKFKIDVVSQDSAGPQPAAAKVVGTFLLTNRTDSEDETPPATYAPSPTPFTQGHAAARSALSAGGIKITNTFATGLRLLLLHSGSDVSEMRSLLSAFPDIALVDEFDARFTPVSLATLTPYDAVIVANNYAFGDPVALGDALADYSDQGGGVIVTVPSFISGFEIRGRFLDQGYMPFNLGTGPTAGSTLGAFDSSHPIMSGVTTASGELLGSVSLSPGAELVASWISGQPLVATKGKAAAVNVFFGATGYWTGDIPLLLHNAAYWSSNAATWVVPAPREGIIPSGGQLGVVVAFDATGQFGGDYYASLLIKSDDPDESSVPVPVHLHVTGAPDIVLEGQQVSIESTKAYTLSGAATTHDLSVPAPPPADGSLELVAEGDYGDFGETATVTAEGVSLGSAGQVGTDCLTAKGSFPLSAAVLSALTADGVVHLQVQNSPIVDAFCPLNQHTVRLKYALPSDHLDFGQLFVGGSRQRSVVIRNAGTDVLHVTSIATNNPAFTTDQSSVDMPPNSADTVTLTFRPTSALPYTGTLTITSDDPDEGVLTISLSGEGLVPPDIDVSPTTLHANLLTGGQQANSVMIRNTGASDLTFDVEVSGPAAVLIQPGPTAPLPTSFDPAVVATAGSATLDEPGPLVSAAAPAGYHAPMTPQSRMAGARVLIVQDAAPWGTAANEQILNSMGVAFDMIPSSSLAGMSLSGYRLIIVPSDQSTNYYLTLGAQQAKLESFVTAGGTLEVHAAGWGWQGGDASLLTIPGGMRINAYSAGSNQVLAPAHPLMAGVPNPFFGGSASHAYFTQIPAGATAVAADDQGRTNLVVYSRGAGTVVAGCQTFEYGFANGQHPGLILQNMIPFSYRPGPAWLSADPTSGRLAPGGSAILTVTFNATGLNGGDYSGVVNVRSNDPDESEVPIAASMHVTGAPDLLVVGRRDSVVSDQNFNTPSAVTTHHLAVVSPAAGDATLELDIDGDFGDGTETATVTVEGIRLGEVGRLGIDCTPGHGAFTILAADLANLLADGFLDVEVRNSFDVDLFCAIQHHRVTLHYPKPVDPIDFGSLFVGRCATENLEVQNVGTDLLTISALSVTGAGFSVTPSSMTLQPGEHRTVSLQFCPQSAQLLHGTLTITSDDPDEGVVTFALQGVGLVPPDIQVSPTALSEQLLTGQVRTRSLTVQNLGGSDLVVELDLQAQGVAVAVETRPLSRQPGPVAVDPHGADAAVASAGAVLDEPGTVRSDQRPEGSRAAAGPQQTMAGATVLLLQDSAPWGSMANETILNGRGIAFDLRSSSQLAGLDLSPYRLIIIPSDQPTGYYLTLSGQASKLDAFVNDGGVLEVHAAGWGFAGGDASLLQLPGGMQIVQYFSATNTIQDPSHPIVAGVPSPFTGNWASHAHFANIPASAQRIIVDESTAPDLVVYPLGFGMVVAAGQTLEFGYVNNQSAGLVLQNMLAFSYRPGPTWLDVNPRAAVIPAGSVATFTVTFDATNLFGGDYSGNLIVGSNDPDESTVVVPVSLHVTGVPDLQVGGKLLTVGSSKTYQTAGAFTSHQLALEAVGPGTAELQLDINGDYGDFVEVATVFVDGWLRLGELGRLGTDCTPGHATFPISAAQFATIAADGLAQVDVHNTFDVDVICAENRHTVTLRYSASISPLDLGSPFVGSCATRVIQVLNRGTDALVVSDVHGSRPEFSASPTSFTLARGDTQEVVVSFCPASAGDFAGTLTIVSNDPDGDATVSLHGIGLVPPDIALARTSATEYLMVGQTSTQVFAIANQSGSDLTVKLGLVLPTAMPALTASRDAVPSGVPAAPIDLTSVRQSYRAFSETSGSRSSVDVARTQAGAPDAFPGGRRPTSSASGLLQLAGAPVANVVPIFYDDFETGGPGWTHRPDSPDSLDLWAISSARASGGTKSWHVAQHAGVGSEVLESPVISLQGYGDATLVFQHWYNFDDCAGSPDFEPDGGILEVREVSTATWQQIHPTGGYPYTLDVVCSNPLELRPAYAHDGQQGSAFSTATFDLTAYAGKSIQVRFHAGWDCGNCENNEGWYVDDVLVYSNTAPWVSVSPTEATIPAGSVENFELKFDATRIGPGQYDANLIVASNDPDESSISVPVRLYVANLMANLDVDPNSLNLGSNGKFVTAYIELPAGHDVNGIVIPGVTLNGVPTAPNAPSVGDNDADGTPDVMVKFARDQVSRVLEEGDDVRIVVAGELAGGDRFMAIDRIRVMVHHVTTPVAGEVVASGTNHTVQWNVPPGWQPDYAELAYTLNGGVTWTPIASGVQGKSYTWSVPDITAPQVRVRVGLFDESGLIAYDSNDGVFQIRSSVTDAGGPPVSSRVQLLPSVPNPFVSGRSTVIAYDLPAPAVVSLAVYSVTGQLTRELVQGTMPAGRHQVTWDGRDRSGRRVSAGVYFVQMKTGTFKASRTITMLN